ncbi:MAG: universal stress protein, partial [Bacteroidales bacterium]|nr:universal stress protein [Bacteroidales bacterium]
MEDKKNQDILVYTDFTEVGEKSVLWASFLARKFKRNLQIIHVINENSLIYFSKDDTYDEAKEALAALCEDISST